MARVFVPASELSGETVELTGDPHRHLVKVLRVKVGEEIGIFDGEGHEVSARVTAVSRKTISLTLGARRKLAGSPVRITLVQGLARGERMDLVVQKTTELGVAAIVPVTSERSQARAAKDERWSHIARAAARQSGRAEVPEISGVIPLIEGARAAGESCPHRLVLWENAADETLVDALAGAARDGGDVCLCVGPEGGFARTEIEALSSLGYRAVTVGPRVLRTETAAIVAVALAQAATGGLA